MKFVVINAYCCEDYTYNIYYAPNDRRDIIMGYNDVELYDMTQEESTILYSMTELTAQGTLNNESFFETDFVTDYGVDIVLYCTIC